MGLWVGEQATGLVGWLDSGLGAGGMVYWYDGRLLGNQPIAGRLFSWSDGWLVGWVAGWMGILWAGRLVAGRLVCSINRNVKGFNVG